MQVTLAGMNETSLRRQVESEGKTTCFWG